MNIYEQLNFVKENVRMCRPSALEKIVQIIENEYANIDDPSAFMLHDFIDNYYYIVYYKDGNYVTDCIGEKAYKKYMDDDDAVRIARKTKELFPKFETLLEKC